MRASQPESAAAMMNAEALMAKANANCVLVTCSCSISANDEPAISAK